MSRYSAAILADGPVAYWRLGEPSGTTVADATGNGHTGNLSGTYALAQAGALANDADTALSVNNGGTGYYLVPDFAAGRFTNSFAIEFWVKLNATGQTNTYAMARNDSGGFSQSAIIYGYVANSFEFFQTGASGSDTRPGSQIVVNDTKWHHVAYSYDGTTWAGYLDGAAVFSTARTFSLYGGALDGWYVGAAFATGGGTNMMLDELAMYGSALSAAKVLAHYQLALARAFSPLQSLAQAYDLYE